MLRNYGRKSVLISDVRIMFFNSDSQLSFSLSYVGGVTVMTRYFVSQTTPWWDIGSKTFLPRFINLLSVFGIENAILNPNLFAKDIKLSEKVLI